MKTKTVEVNFGLLEDRNLTQAAYWSGDDKYTFIKKVVNNFNEIAKEISSQKGKNGEKIVIYKGREK